MKKLLCYSLLLLVIFSVIPNDSHAFEVVGLKDNNVIIKNYGSNSYDIVRYVARCVFKQASWCWKGGYEELESVCWKRERLRFPATGLYDLPMDLSKAKSGKLYAITILNHNTGQKFKLYSRIVNGKFQKKGKISDY